jgi:hypothetical protein
MPTKRVRVGYGSMNPGFLKMIIAVGAENAMNLPILRVLYIRSNLSNLCGKFFHRIRLINNEVSYVKGRAM